MATGEENKSAALSWLNTFLRDSNLQLARVGSGNANSLGTHTIDVTTGNWGNVAHSKSKPPRWLLQFDLTATPITAVFPEGGHEGNIGHVTTTASRQTAGVAVRIVPLLKTGPGPFDLADDFEAVALFVFHGGLVKGSSSDSISLDISNGKLLRVLNGERVPAPYIFAGILGQRPRTDAKQVTINGTPSTVTYGQVIDALHATITVHVQGGTAMPIEAYDLSVDSDLARLKTDIETAWHAAGPPPVAVVPAGVAAPEQDDDQFDVIDPATLHIPPDPGLLGVDASVYRQINALLRSGKQHIMLYGPPGTGKTTLARHIASSLPGGDWTLVTGSSDWSSQDIIGGYQPVGDGNVDFVAGVLLRNFARPLIIDELNRCDIDKVIGPLFTVLSGQQTTLPYRTDLADVDSQPYVILPQPKSGAANHEFAPGPAWRLIATINSIDKASLYQMSYALSRRFGWVYVDAPVDLPGFIAEYVARTDPVAPAPAAGMACPLAAVWAAINAARVERYAERTGHGAAVLVLSNDPAYWQPRRRAGTVDAAFDLADARQLGGTLQWDARAGAGTTKGREAPLEIRGSHPLAWRDFSDLGGIGGRFR